MFHLLKLFKKFKFVSGKTLVLSAASHGSFCAAEVVGAEDIHERSDILNQTIRCALSAPHTSRAPGFATQDIAQARHSNAALGNNQDMEATSVNL
jgi:hypothetical protein